MFKSFFFFLALFIGLFAWAVYDTLHLLPSSQQIKGCMTTKMHKVNLCPGSKDYVPLKSISSYLQKAVILTEDSAFYQHHGFDWQQIEKSARENWQTGSYKRGGSTISQQLAKNLFLTKEKTLTRKLREAIITYQIEKTLSKKEILERYFNVVEFGNNIYGIKSAAQFYFKKHPSELSIVESSFLAMLLPNPKGYSRSFYKKELTPFARQRLDSIINNLYQYKRISEEEFLAANNELAYFLQDAPAHALPDGFDLNVDESTLEEEGTEVESLPEVEAETTPESSDTEEVNNPAAESP